MDGANKLPDMFMFGTSERRAFDFQEVCGVIPLEFLRLSRMIRLEKSTLDNSGQQASREYCERSSVFVIEFSSPKRGNKEERTQGLRFSPAFETEIDSSPQCLENIKRTSLACCIISYSAGDHRMLIGCH